MNSVNMYDVCFFDMFCSKDCMKAQLVILAFNVKLAGQYQNLVG